MNIFPVRFCTTNNYKYLSNTSELETPAECLEIQEYKPLYYTPSFCSAAELNIRYLMNKRAKYLPERVLSEIKKICETKENNLPTIRELHAEIYEVLFKAKSLDEAKKLYPEFKDVKDIIEIKDNQSKSIAAIGNTMPLEEFTLQYLKDLYAPMKLDDIVKKYNLTNKSILFWLNKKLNIQKLDKQYIILHKMADETENAKSAELTRAYLSKHPEQLTEMHEKAYVAMRTPEALAKKSESTKIFYEQHPQKRRAKSLLSKLTWEKCPEIRAALKQFAYEQELWLRNSFYKKNKKDNLNNLEKIQVKTLYKRFWESYPEYKEKYAKARLEAIEELRAKGIVPPKKNA